VVAGPRNNRKRTPTPMTWITAKVLSDDGTCAEAPAEPASRQPGYEPHPGLEVLCHCGRCFQNLDLCRAPRKASSLRRESPLARGLEPASQNGTFAPPHLTTFSLELIDLRANRRVAAPLLLVLPVEPTGGVPGLRATRRLRARSARGGRGRGGADPAQSSLRRG